MKHDRTFRIDRLYHKFLKPKNIPIEKLHDLIQLLDSSGFIELVLQHDEIDTASDRYIETEKLTSRQHRDELFKLIQGLI